jgi:hypothetical protein
MLGHHSPDFTLRVYAHLIPGDEVKPLDLDAELFPRPNVAPIRRTQLDPTEPKPEFAETAQ